MASAAGFDSVPADMGVLHAMSLFPPPARCTYVETLLTIRGGPQGLVGEPAGHAALLESEALLLAAGAA